MVKTKKCHFECSKEKCGSNEFECESCAHLSLQIENDKQKCLSYCPSGFFADYATKTCSPCHRSCSECSGPSNMMCVACKSGFSLLTDSHTCVEQCPSGYFKSMFQKQSIIVLVVLNLRIIQ